jgi:hypothetical protein
MVYVTVFVASMRQFAYHTYVIEMIVSPIISPL